MSAGKITTDEIKSRLEAAGSEKNKEGMQRFGICFEKAFGAPLPIIRTLAKEIGKNHELAMELWENPYHEIKLLATMIAEPKKLNSELMDKWAAKFYSWDICDQCCANLFRNNLLAWEKAIIWCKDDREFVKRAGFVLMAQLCVKDKKADDKKFEAFFPYLIEGAEDERNMVKKAVNWALRQIGKRNISLNEKALDTAEIIYKKGNKAARWIAADAIRELKEKQKKM
ncbi:MAG: DNA alkylation repair protein [Bacteroidetes bacterium RIFOXYA12_FULL_35_11]|nr:MAG: DNA alkylation repair protein [Bacteroidetes bacterium GWF2_35_48]OFY82990.1 MAG: DNA alkylation repair protein [Bacteroidetes bacterium RIFOXYA12_FULL_35_11]OFY96127.1 MAG: DNA alkylation repair protein [Bacteroidetes bacterium RIFOXYB2_FULL_35_7]OFZ00741.1 MAG: DNA alkylation repair protein [Bacteroidetes bacterium RIFOXYC12_FULL_35_7]HBX49493.1 DNA alkylation repair protein [Bacteroidales bacterium]